jgi:anthranilate synthase component 1
MLGAGIAFRYSACTPMLRPGFDEFARLAQDATLVPVVRSIHADLLTPVSAYLAVTAGEPNAFLLESVEGGEKLARYTFLGARPYMVLRAAGDEITIVRGRKQEKRRGSVFEVLRQLLGEHRPAQVPGAPPFTAGAVGYVSYDTVRQLERLPQRARQDVDVPGCLLMFFDRLLAFDHVRHQIHIIAAADVRGGDLKRAYQRATRDIAQIEKRLAAGLKRLDFRAAAAPGARPPAPRSSVSHGKFLASVRRAQEYIAAGDIFQVVLSQRLEFPLRAAPFAVYRALRALNPSPYMYFLRMGGLHVLGSSPEMLVRVTGRKIEYRPIAGTRPRGASDAEDAALERELLADEKERAEHVMLVDLGRNDVGRVSEYGSVRVRDLMYVERYSHVMHLVSAIEGKLRGGLDALDAFASCFPAGTLTGAPKVRAMQIIEELEPVRRGIYGGSVLYADFSGNLDSCIAIRTMVVKGKKAYVQAGAGIVADSDPEKEFEECRNKARALVRAAELAGR